MTTMKAMKKILASAMALVMAASIGIGALAASASGGHGAYTPETPVCPPLPVPSDGGGTTENQESQTDTEPEATPTAVKSNGGAATVPVTITSALKEGSTEENPQYDAPVFSVTVPASLPLTINADGSVTTPDNLEIINGSAGSVKVTNVQFNDGDKWSFVPFEGSDFASMKVSSNKLGLSLTANSKTVKSGDEGEALKPNWTIAKGASLGITAAAEASAVSKTVTETNAASVVFTVGWNAAE